MTSDLHPLTEFPGDGDVPGYEATLLRIVQSLQAQFREGSFAPGVSTQVLERPEGGKMLGLLLAKSRERGWVYLKAFSGQYGEEWVVPGWVPPVFLPQRLDLQQSGEARVKALTEQIDKLPEGSRERVRLVHDRRQLSRETMQQVFGSYEFRNFQGEKAHLLDLFSPQIPPWGAGDCAAPKLLAHAQREKLVPQAMAEFWWGKPAKSGERVEGEFYLPCRIRCGPVIEFLVRGQFIHWMSSTGLQGVT